MASDFCLRHKIFLHLILEELSSLMILLLAVLSSLFINNKQQHGTKAMVSYFTIQWLSDIVLDSRPKGSRFEPHCRLCVVIIEQDTLIPA